MAAWRMTVKVAAASKLPCPRRMLRQRAAEPSAASMFSGPHIANQSGLLPRVGVLGWSHSTAVVAQVKDTAEPRPRYSRKLNLRRGPTAVGSSLCEMGVARQASLAREEMGAESAGSRRRWSAPRRRLVVCGTLAGRRASASRLWPCSSVTSSQRRILKPASASSRSFDEVTENT